MHGVVDPDADEIGVPVVAARVARELALDDAVQAVIVELRFSVQVRVHFEFRLHFLHARVVELDAAADAEPGIEQATVENFLLVIGVSPEIARRDAEGMEHHVSEETLAMFKQFTLKQGSLGE